MKQTCPTNFNTQSNDYKAYKFRMTINLK